MKKHIYPLLFVLLALCACSSQEYEFKLLGGGGGSSSSLGKPIDPARVKANTFIATFYGDTLLLDAIGKSTGLKYYTNGVPYSVGNTTIDYAKGTFDCEGKTYKMALTSQGYISEAMESHFDDSGWYDINETNTYKFSYDSSGHMTDYTYTSRQEFSDGSNKYVQTATCTAIFEWSKGTLVGFGYRATDGQETAANTWSCTFDIVNNGNNNFCQPVPAIKQMILGDFSDLVYSGMLGLWSDKLITQVSTDYIGYEPDSDIVTVKYNYDIDNDGVIGRIERILINTTGNSTYGTITLDYSLYPSRNLTPLPVN